MSTPGKGRVSGIPTPGKLPSSIPTPGLSRSRSASSATQRPNQDDEFASKAFADALKAYHPANHNPPRPSDVPAPSSLSPSYPSQPNLRSTTTRPSSAASSSSAISSGNPRTPAASNLRASTAARPPSRQSDAFGRSSSRAGHTFEIGDEVRIQSLGQEGTLRYLGEIAGKDGLWAGIELSGGFAGRGKNDGAVEGVQYFVCPPKCGVFINPSKLSAPVDRTSRPSSVASSRNGRATPSLPSAFASGRRTPSASYSNGRVTPSFSNGRVTPSMSTGRVTPAGQTGRRTPSNAPPTARPKPAASGIRTPATTPGRAGAKPATFTPGSRADKYNSMTAKQLRSTPTAAQRAQANSPTRSNGFGSPIQSSRNLSSPTRSVPGSPFHTPKALPAPRTSGIGITTPSKARPSLSTPRPRIPSAIAMPPPASPSTTSRSASGNGPQTPVDPPSAGLPLSDLSMNGKALQDRINGLLASKTPSSPRPESRTSDISLSHALAAPDLQPQLDALQVRLDTLEAENQRLRATNVASEREASSRIESLATERDKAAARLSELEASARTAERALAERDTQIEALQRAAERAAQDVEKARGDGDARARDLQSKLEDKEALVAQLREAVEAREGLQSENDALLKAKKGEIALLEARVQKAYAELEEERRELGGQVEELREAGQETIALYEERLSAADGRRYELEDKIILLEEQLKAQLAPPSPGAQTRQATTAVEIDNEMLREQVQHLQKKLAALEDALEDAQAANEREEQAVHDRLRRYKEREEAMRKDVAEGKLEVERVLRDEQKARLRVEELEEALRENTVALENARAEIEGLRNEIADLEGAAAMSPKSSEKIAEMAQRSSERTRLLEEIAGLKQQLSASKAAGLSEGDLEDIQVLQADRDALQAELADERAMVDELRSELDAVRKKFNRDQTINGVDPRIPPSPSKSDLSAARDEITGLKHIVQELQKENSASAQRCKVLEAENKLLVSETAQLRDDLKALEDDVERSLLREEAILANEVASPTIASEDTQALQQRYKEMKVKHEAEVEQLRKKQAEAEMKTARTIHDLNKEIGELESLIESKIYREDELERELERLKDKLARSQKKSSKTDLPEDRSRLRSQSSMSSLASSHQEEPTGPVCEICERPGHDIFTCDLLKEDVPASASSSRFSISRADEEVICEDCEERGHTAANCPNSLDVF